MEGTSFRYVIKARAQMKIRSFYKNVARKYRHTYDFDDFMRNVHDAVFAIYQIEVSLPRRKPTLSRWKGYHMANTEKWYFAYTINGDTITIVDACHAQNMYNKDK